MERETYYVVVQSWMQPNGAGAKTLGRYTLLEEARKALLNAPMPIVQGIMWSKTVHGIYGKIRLKNGLVISWLQFVDGRMARADAEVEAVRIVSAQHKGVTERCWLSPRTV